MASALLATLAPSARCTAQAPRWNSPSALALVERVIARRAAQRSDSGLAGYSAKARGTLEFLAQFGDTALIPPKIIRSAEIATNLYWSAPNISRQVVVGLRDTSVVPMDIGFYRDRYGVVEANFPDRIRLGDGNDVADVVHPFSAAGLQAYDFALLDSFSIVAGGRRLVLQAVAFRPRDATRPLAIGTAYVARGTGDIVRLSLTFTRSALLDKRIEALSVVLENELVEGRFWLPYRQELEVQRGGTLFDFPARGIVRARWSVCCYDLRPGAASVARAMGGSGIVVRPGSELRQYAFGDSLFTDMRVGGAAATPDDVARVQAQVRELVSRRMLSRPPGAAFAAGGISDLVRFDRAEGVAAGVGGVARFGGVAVACARVRYGLADERAKGEVSLSFSLDDDRPLRVFAEREYRDVSDARETSGVLNSLSAQEFASDRTDPFDVRGAGLELLAGRHAGLRWRIRAETESERPLSVRAQAVSGSFLPIVAATPGRSGLLSFIGDAGHWQPAGAAQLSADGEVRFGAFRGSDSTAGFPLSHFARGYAHMRLDAPAGTSGLVAETFATLALSNGPLPVQQRVFFGGPLTGPGYEFHQFVGRAGVSQRLEWQHSISGIPIALGSLGRVPLVTKVAMYVHAVWIDPPVGGSATYPAIGAAAELFSGAVRVDVARGLRGPRQRWTFDIDAGRAFWSIL